MTTPHEREWRNHKSSSIRNGRTMIAQIQAGFPPSTPGLDNRDVIWALLDAQVAALEPGHNAAAQVFALTDDPRLTPTACFGLGLVLDAWVLNRPEQRSRQRVAQRAPDAARDDLRSAFESAPGSLLNAMVQSVQALITAGVLP